MNTVSLRPAQSRVLTALGWGFPAGGLFFASPLAVRDMAATPLMPLSSRVGSPRHGARGFF